MDRCWTWYASIVGSTRPIPRSRSEGVWSTSSYTYCISCQKFSSVFHINGLDRSSSMRKPLCGGEKRTALWASHPEERGSDEAVVPPVYSSGPPSPFSYSRHHRPLRYQQTVCRGHGRRQCALRRAPSTLRTLRA